jgi:hypothetical protein
MRLSINKEEIVYAREVEAVIRKTISELHKLLHHGDGKILAAGKKYDGPPINFPVS